MTGSRSRRRRRTASFHTFLRRRRSATWPRRPRRTLPNGRGLRLAATSAVTANPATAAVTATDRRDRGDRGDRGDHRGGGGARELPLPRPPTIPPPMVLGPQVQSAIAEAVVAGVKTMMGGTGSATAASSTGPVPRLAIGAMAAGSAGSALGGGGGGRSVQALLGGVVGGGGLDLGVSLQPSINTTQGARGFLIQAAEACNAGADAGRQMAVIAAKAGKAFEWEAQKLSACQAALMELAQQIPQQ